MSKKIMWVVLAAVTTLGLAPQVQAQGNTEDVAALRKEMDKQYEALAKMQARILELEETQKKQSTTISDMSKATNPSEMKLPETLKWIEKLKFSGDFRYRIENQDFDTRSDERDRHRIRARLGLEAVINEDWTVGLRFATGSTEISTSTNQTLGDSDDDGSAFSRKDLWLDLAYADWHPIKGLNVLMGKMENPFYAVGKHQLIWDGDLTPEGIAGKYVWKFNDCVSAQITGGGFWLKENSGGSDLSVFGAQGLLKYALSDSSSLTGGVSYFDFGDLRNTTIDTDVLKQKGNTWSASRYVYNYDVFESFGEYAFKVGEMPMSAYGTYVTNLASDVEEDKGWALGVTFNKAKDPGSWQFGYEYRDVEADAVVGGLCDSDFIDGGTGGRGHRFSLAYQLAKNVQTVFSYYLAERHDNAMYNGEEMNLFQADLVIKF
ncbi:MAG: hypothetical protein GX455_00550 [Phycisphaerae bacterium]|nr:hypothetical protein [Phycisphaerae bacterium]